MTVKKYNGWTNYETWNVKLWIDNDVGSYSCWRDAAQEIFEEQDGDKEVAAFVLSKRLEDETKENAPYLGASTYSDLLNAALSEVNWLEIAESLIEECDPIEEDEDEKGEN
jgi:hypothetical protein